MFDFLAVVIHLRALACFWSSRAPAVTTSPRSLRALTEYVDPVDIPFYDLIDLAAVDAALDQIMVTDAWTDLDDAGFTLGAEFSLGKLPPLHLPGLDQVKLTFDQDGYALGVLTCGDETSLRLEALDLALEFSPDILSDEATGRKGAAIRTRCAVELNGTGFHFLTFPKASLPRSRVAGTPIVITLKDIELGPGGDKYFSVQSGKIELPMFTRAGNKPLVLTGEDLSFGRHGPSGLFAKTGGSPLELNVFGFKCQLDQASIALENGRLRDVNLRGRLDLSRFAPNAKGDGWVSVDFSIGSAGLTATLSDTEPLIELRAAGMFALAVSTIRLAGPTKTEPGALWVSGSLTPEIEGLDGEWPAFAFDEIGITADGKLRLAEGAQIATTQPFTLSWNFASLCITGFSLERPENAPDDLKLRLSASVEVVKGLPAGASVDGLVAHWHAGEVSVNFNGIGLTFGVPGAYAASVSFSWNRSDKTFKGSGSLTIPSIDLQFAAIFEAREVTSDTGDKFNALFLAAETSLPAGVPIASTGLSLYAVSGILAHNYQIKTNDPLDPKRFYKAFMDPPQGFAAISKWQAVRGAHAIGLGVVIGTGDDGWAFSTRGALILSLPDLSVLVTASADVMTKREPLDSGPAGKLAAVLALHPAQKLLRLDFGFDWTEDPIFQVQGEGGGEFRFDRPLEWSVWAGLSPERGSPITASLLRLDSKWLLSGGYWMAINAKRSVNMGALAPIDLRGGSRSVYAELVGSVRAEMGFTWAPYQLEGKLDINARARIVAGKLSLGLRISSGVTAYLPEPKYLRIPLNACIEFNLRFKTIRICLHYAFEWGDLSRPRPTLPLLQHGLSISPRDWVPRASSDIDKAVDNGIVAWPLSDTIGAEPLKIVHPHSVLALEFAKSMSLQLRDPTLVHLNDTATPYPEAIGGKSGYVARWSLTHLALRDENVGKDVQIFGTFQRSPVEREDKGRRVNPRPPNTQLWLLSSNRFGPGGSIGGGGGENTPPADCDVKCATIRECVSLGGLNQGWGRLQNDWPYQWEDRDTPGQYGQYGVQIGVEDLFVVSVPQEIKKLYFMFVDLIGGALPADPWTIEEQVFTNSAPVPLRLSDPNRLYLSICWDELIVADGSGTNEDWHGSTGKEEWSVAPEMRILHPGHRYTLSVEALATLLKGEGTVGTRRFNRQYQFQADRAPHWLGALEHAVEAVYPQDGRRPAFRHYDIVVRFGDDYVRQLYELDNRRLGIRLLDGNGIPVEFAPGKTISPRAPWKAGELVLPPIEEWWRKARAPDPCETSGPVPDQADTVLPVTIAGLNLLPLSRYSVELVAVEDETTEATTDPLARWSFTTSAFMTFSELAGPPVPVPAFGLIQSAPAIDDSFDALAKSFAVPVVAVVSATRITPVRRDDSVAYLLIEAPEPLDDVGGRLAVMIGTHPTRLVANLDRTRIVAELQTLVALEEEQQMLEVALHWTAAPAGAPAEDHRTVGGVATPEICTWSVPLRGLFG